MAIGGVAFEREGVAGRKRPRDQDAGIRRCPFQIGIVSTGLIVQGAAEAGALLDSRFGTVVLDEAHKARKSRGIGASGEPNRLLQFMLALAQRAKHVILGTATPVQTDVEELWDLLEVLNQGAEHVLGRYGSPWRRASAAIPVLTGEKVITEESEAWNWLRNPLPARREHALFDLIRSDLRVRADNFSTDRPVTDLEDFTRAELRDAMESQVDGVGCLPGNNPILRHTVLRKRATLEDMGLLERIAVDIWPSEHEHLSMFDGVALHTSAEFDAAVSGDSPRRNAWMSESREQVDFQATSLPEAIECIVNESILSGRQRSVGDVLAAPDETLEEAANQATKAKNLMELFAPIRGMFEEGELDFSRDPSPGRPSAPTQ